MFKSILLTARENILVQHMEKLNLDLLLSFWLYVSKAQAFSARAVCDDAKLRSRCAATTPQPLKPLSGLEVDAAKSQV